MGCCTFVIIVLNGLVTALCGCFLTAHPSDNIFSVVWPSWAKSNRISIATLHTWLCKAKENEMNNIRRQIDTSHCKPEELCWSCISRRKLFLINCLEQPNRQFSFKKNHPRKSLNFRIAAFLFSAHHHQNHFQGGSFRCWITFWLVCFQYRQFCCFQEK